VEWRGLRAREKLLERGEAAERALHDARESEVRGKVEHARERVRRHGWRHRRRARGVPEAGLRRGRAKAGRRRGRGRVPERELGREEDAGVHLGRARARTERRETAAARSAAARKARTRLRAGCRCTRCSAPRARRRIRLVGARERVREATERAAGRRRDRAGRAARGEPPAESGGTSAADAGPSSCGASASARSGRNVKARSSAGAGRGANASKNARSKRDVSILGVRRMWRPSLWSMRSNKTRWIVVFPLLRANNSARAAVRATRPGSLTCLWLEVVSRDLRPLLDHVAGYLEGFHPV
jgi:hypothetical protein